MKETEGTVLVIKPIHNAQKRAYEYKATEVPAELAEEQLSKDDSQRNFAWQGVRFADDEEKAAYYNKPITTEDKKRPSRPVKAE